MAHIHQFKRHTYKRSGSHVFFCVDDTCKYKIDPKMALGKLCICWRCGEEFKLNEIALRLVKPHCMNCNRPKDGSKPKPRSTDSAGDLKSRLVSLSRADGPKIEMDSISDSDDLL